MITSATDQNQLNHQIQQAKLECDNLTQKLADVEAELEKELTQIPVYKKLIEISDQLEQLHESGAGELFWAGMFSSEAELLAHIQDLRLKSANFDESIKAIRQKKTDVEQQIKNSQHQLAYLQHDLQYHRELEEESKNHFVVHREFEHSAYRPVLMPWSSQKDDEKRFRQYFLLALLYSILAALIIPGLKLPVPEKVEVVEIPERLAQFIKREKQKQEPKPKPQPQVETKAASKEKPTKEEVKKARDKAATTGLLAFKNNFADLMDEVSEAKLGASAQLSKQGSSAKSSSRSIITQQALSGSSGINTASLSREVGGAGGKIGAVKFSRVTSEIGTAIDDRPLSDSPGPSRTDEEIQIVFDRYKAALYRIYNRELRKNPTLQGKMVLRITIASDGSVTACKVESTDLASPVLSEKIVDRVKRFNFGAKDGVPKITILYPIDFLPAS